MIFFNNYACTELKSKRHDVRWVTRPEAKTYSTHRHTQSHIRSITLKQCASSMIESGADRWANSTQTPSSGSCCDGGVHSLLIQRHNFIYVVLESRLSQNLSTHTVLCNSFSHPAAPNTSYYTFFDSVQPVRTRHAAISSTLPIRLVHYFSQLLLFLFFFSCLRHYLFFWPWVETTGVPAPTTLAHVTYNTHKISHPTINTKHNCITLGMWMYLHLIWCA